ncbi:biotin--[acetyl-CoA-carboxylase] ligase [Thiovibrio frasassiensis]|uniref:Biotin--[acetyl-CoA-carboxylase] ligase n=1 Tax=Thiovibrio frasassiensis TaxID=2984131 RepID=A0A9X4MBJ3_9BACT|nr:biotin--[acetyl-CoA-carboxylase] ligase [Thiovibrio frasassiensis]MDG4474569.1 biotin--[acetyl-CoA-carboxylase] ligase [Thiovibrio frasassiensis]
MVAPLSFQTIRQLISDVEIPSRLGHYPAELVQAVYRYGAPVGSTILHLPQADRLMPLARQRINEDETRGHSCPSGMAFLADELTGSRGRFQRSWYAPPGGLWLTLVMANTLLPESMRLYPLAAGMACCEAIRSYGIDARVKWVNDVHVSGRKICGVLCESFTSSTFAEEYVLIGVGLNVNNLPFPAELGATAVSMKEILGCDTELTSFAARLLAKFSWSFGLLCHDEAQRLAADDGSGAQLPDSLLLAGWRELSDSVGRKVWFGFDVQRQPQYQAEVLGLAPDGGIVLRHLESGGEIVEHSGELLYID